MGTLSILKILMLLACETLSPGDTKKWDVMFKDDSRADNVEVEIVDYKIQ